MPRGSATAPTERLAKAAKSCRAAWPKSREASAPASGGRASQLTPAPTGGSVPRASHATRAPTAAAPPVASRAPAARPPQELLPKVIGGGAGGGGGGFRKSCNPRALASVKPAAEAKPDRPRSLLLGDISPAGSAMETTESPSVGGGAGGGHGSSIRPRPRARAGNSPGGVGGAGGGAASSGGGCGGSKKSAWCKSRSPSQGAVTPRIRLSCVGAGILVLCGGGNSLGS
mmetsp:Transcript_45970/g.133186  ORF Transcript_45970/g.133186 Transcript_45970/m.133186 type:complete len:229 (+) Transcript_45970:420-1106(+)